jgi:hypothetical protein
LSRQRKTAMLYHSRTLARLDRHERARHRAARRFDPSARMCAASPNFKAQEMAEAAIAPHLPGESLAPVTAGACADELPVVLQYCKPAARH